MCVNALNLTLLGIGVRPTAYADDTTIVVGADSLQELEESIKKALNAVADWAKTAEIELNTDKTEVMSVGRKTIKSLIIDEKETEVKRSLKCLGIVIDDKLLWRAQIDHMEAKTERLLLRVAPMCWTNDILKVKDRLRLYRQVFMPMIMYGHEVWYEEIRTKVTYLERITRLQRRVLRAATGAYKTTSTSRLLELTNEIPIEEELRIRSETKSLEKQLRASRRKELRKQWRAEQEKRYDLSKNFDFEQTKKKETVWCLTETGPNRKFLALIGLEEDESCRLCGDPAETVQHLMFECERTPRDCRLEGDYSTEAFELASTRLVKLLRLLN